MASVRRRAVRPVNDGPMSAGEYRTALEGVGLSQRGAARFFGIAERTSRTWALDEAPVHPTVALLLRYMVREGLSADDVKPA